MYILWRHNIYMQYLNKLKHAPISDIDILKKIKTRIVVYSDLKKYKRLEDIFINDSFVILYEKTAGDIGHWCCCIRRGNTVSYFDSYGRLPDPEKYFTAKPQYPYLSKLLIESPYNLEYSEYNYQKRGMSTCGRHVIMRILMKDEPLEEYHKIMTRYKDEDELVTIISELI